jgi:hypothetical protein
MTDDTVAMIVRDDHDDELSKDIIKWRCNVDYIAVGVSSSAAARVDGRAGVLPRGGRRC